MRVALTTGSYVARSIIASAQRSVNLFAEANPKDSPSPFTWYNVPGLTSLGFAPGLPGRALYWANNGLLYYVAGSHVYQISSAWGATLLGSIGTTDGVVSMGDNGTTLGIVDGSANGYQIDLSTNAFSMINAANNSPPPTSTFAFYGADRVDVLDGYALFNQPGTRNFYSTYNNEMVFDSLFFAAKNGYSDNLVTLIVSRRELWLLGERTSEIWFDSGDAAFPFQILPGPFVQHGCLAKYSVAQVNGAIFWLAQDQAGKAQIVRAEGYKATPISTEAMENEFASYVTLSDAQGFCFTMNGHTFYQLNFPTANKTWRWDEKTPGIWHEAVWIDSDGNENRHRASCAAWAYDTNVCADWETGELYKFDMNNHTDNGAPMVFRRGYPHMMKDGRQVIYPGFTLDVEAATSPNTSDPPGPFPILGGPGGVNGAPSIDGSPPEDAILGGPAGFRDVEGFVLGDSELGDEDIGGSHLAPASNAPLVWLRWSDDRGRTFSNPISQSLGATGQYLTQPQWNRLGRSRDRIFEIYGTIPGKLAVNGAFLDPEPIPLVN